MLLKPADAQFLVSTARLQPWRATNLLTAGVVFGYAFHLLDSRPTAPGVAAALVLLALSATLLYSLWILCISAAFYVVRIDNLTYLFSSIFDAARWPSSVFRGSLSFVFTFVIPLSVMTTYPALALLGRLEWPRLVAATAGTVLFALTARLVWRVALGRYASASS